MSIINWKDQVCTHYLSVDVLLLTAGLLVDCDFASAS